MKKLILVAMLMVGICTGTAGAVSQDTGVYVRQDVFDAKMEALFEKLHGEIESLGENLRGEIRALSIEIRGLDNRINDLRQDIYLGLVILGLLAGFPAAKEFFKWREETRKPSITLDDVRHIVEEYNARPQAGLNSTCQ